MAFIAPPGRRSRFEHTPEGQDLIIPAERSIFTIAFLSLWLCGWAVGEVSAARTLLSGESVGDAPRGFLLVWLVAWTAGGGAALWSLAWMLLGQERVRVHQGRLILRREVLGWGRSKEYGLADVQGLRAIPGDLTRPWRRDMKPRARLRFDHGARTVRFGDGLEEAEGRVVVEELRERFGVDRG